MKYINILLTLVVLMLTISCVNSQKVIYANDTNKLNRNQQYLFDHSKETYLNSNNKIVLPSEINVLFGDSSIKTNIVAQPIWDKAYFVKDREDDVLILPLKANYNNEDIFSDLIVIKADTIYPTMVSTYFKCEKNETTEYVHFESTVNGALYRVLVYDDSNNIIKEFGSKNSLVTCIPERNGYKSSYIQNHSEYSILNNHDWRNANRTGYHRDEQGNIRLHKWH